jgi:acylphosphatase
MLEQVHVFISGNVQGVGFRQSTYAEATKLGLPGWVRNLPDGRVGAVFEGGQESLDLILAWCKKGPTFSRVDSVEIGTERITITATTFEIRY